MKATRFNSTFPRISGSPLVAFATIILTSVIGSKTVTVLTVFDFDLVYCIFCMEDVKFGCTSNLLNELYTF